MRKVFISGSRNIRRLDDVVIDSLNRIISKGMQILIGDAKGVDRLVQEYLAKERYFNVIVYTVCSSPRNLISDRFLIKRVSVSGNFKGRKLYEQKDIIMTKECDYLFVIWDGKSKGSYNNILRGIEYGKKIKVYYKKEDRFLDTGEINVNIIREIYLKNIKLHRKRSRYTSDTAVQLLDFQTLGWERW
jgi:hypothetical protein